MTRRPYPADRLDLAADEARPAKPDPERLRSFARLVLDWMRSTGWTPPLLAQPALTRPMLSDAAERASSREVAALAEGKRAESRPTRRKKRTRKVAK